MTSGLHSPRECPVARQLAMDSAGESIAIHGSSRHLAILRLSRMTHHVHQEHSASASNLTMRARHRSEARIGDPRHHGLEIFVGVGCTAGSSPCWTNQEGKADTGSVLKASPCWRRAGCPDPGRSDYRKANDGALLAPLRSLVDERPTYSYWRIAVLMNRERFKRLGPHAVRCALMQRR
jgi:hypothetical protein